MRRVVVPGWAEPADVRERMFGDADWQVWLDAGPNASTNVQPGLSYLGAGRTRVVTASVERGTVTERILSNGLERTIETTIFEFVRGDLESHVEASTTDEVPNSEAHFRLGWVGWLGYELGSQTIGAPTSHAGISDEGTSDEQIPDACLIFLDRLIEFDHATQTIYALSFESDTGWSEEVASVVRQSQPKHKESSVTLDRISVTTRHSRTAY